MVHGAPDFTKVMRGETDEVWIKGVVFRDPSVAASKPVSVENPALAYEVPTDRFKVKVEDFPAFLDQLPYDILARVETCDKIEFTYDVDQDVETIKFYDGVALLLTLTFGYDANKNVTSITRT